MRVTVGVGEHERARCLPAVRVEGLELNVEAMEDDGKRHDRFLAGEFDACEFSMALYVAMLSRGQPWTAIPVFPNRRFRHSFVYINTRSGIQSPKDLEGKRVGISSWFNTAATWMRGNLEDGYGVNLIAIEWVTSRPPEVGGWTPPAGFRVHPAPAGGDLVNLLLTGELDAIIVPSLIRPFRERDPRVARLFPEYLDAEMDYFRRTQIFPISHAIVVRTSVIDQDEEVPLKLWQAFVEAKRRSNEYTKHPGHSNLVWYGAWQERERSVFGNWDPWNYTVSGNRVTLDAFLGYARRQGLLARDLKVEDLFHSSTLSLTEA